MYNTNLTRPVTHTVISEYVREISEYVREIVILFYEIIVCKVCEM